jgi:hypothetical protein
MLGHSRHRAHHRHLHQRAVRPRLPCRLDLGGETASYCDLAAHPFESSVETSDSLMLTFRLSGLHYRFWRPRLRVIVVGRPNLGLGSGGIEMASAHAHVRTLGPLCGSLRTPTFTRVGDM